MRFLLAVLLIGTVAAGAEGKTWQGKMRDLSNALSEAIPFLYPDPSQDVKGLNEKVKKIYEISKGLDVKFDHAQKVKDFDPALPYLAGMLKQDIERAYLSMQDGNPEYAKAVIRSSTAYCIACHTRTKEGVEYPLLSAFAQPLKKASWITRIEFMAASRQFDAVLVNVMGELAASGNPGISPMDLERGSRIALSVAVRVKKDREKAQFLARAIEKSPTATFSMKEGAKVWKADISEWQKDKTKYATDEDLIKAARALVTKARRGSSPLGGHDEVKYLRATVLLHDLLRQYPLSEFVGESLYLIGQSYDSLQDLGTWSLQDVYFLACIDQVPHTKMSDQCYKEYERSITLGYSGSSGVHVPKQVKKHLETLKLKAAAL